MRFSHNKVKQLYNSQICTINSLENSLLNQNNPHRLVKSRNRVPVLKIMMNILNNNQFNYHKNQQTKLLINLRKELQII